MCIRERMRFSTCEFCKMWDSPCVNSVKNWDFGNVNPVKNGIFKMWIGERMRFSTCEFFEAWHLSQSEIVKMWISVKNEILKMWILSKMEILEMWICQIMTFPRVHSVFSFIFSEIPEVLLLKILFFPSFAVKFQRVFCSKFCFSLHSQWNPRGSFAQNSSFPRNLSRQKSHKIWPKSMSPKKTPGNSVFCMQSKLWKSPEPCKWGQNVCFSQQLETVKIEFWHEFEQKKGSCQTCKHSISIYFYYPKLDILQQQSSNFLKMRLFQGFSSTVCNKGHPLIQVSGHQKWDFLKGFHPQCTPGMRMRLF